MNSATPLPARRVLVVDDNEDAAELLSIMLDMIGQTAAVAHSGPDCLSMAVQFLPDLIFLDIGMPGMNGFDTALALRAMPSLEKTMLVALTGWDDAQTRSRALASGFDRHLTKPATLELIEDVLRHYAVAARAN